MPAAVRAAASWLERHARAVCSRPQLCGRVTLAPSVHVHNFAGASRSRRLFTSTTLRERHARAVCSSPHPLRERHARAVCSSPQWKSALDHSATSPPFEMPAPPFPPYPFIGQPPLPPHTMLGPGVGPAGAPPRKVPESPGRTASPLPYKLCFCRVGSILTRWIPTVKPAGSGPDSVFCE